eukprot:9111572-Alexandrium_andersonii.AAC.1
MCFFRSECVFSKASDACDLAALDHLPPSILSITPFAQEADRCSRPGREGRNVMVNASANQRGREIVG